MGVNDTMEAVSAAYEYGLKTLGGKTLWKENGECIIDTETAFTLKLNNSDETKDSYLYITYTVNGETKTNVFSLDFWHSCSFESDYAVDVKVNGNKAVVTIKANKFAKSVFVSLPDNFKYTYSDNYIDVEAGTEKSVIITANESIDVTKLTVTDFAKASK